MKKYILLFMLLISFNIYPNIFDAAKNGDLRSMKKYISDEVDINAISDGDTALSLASKNGHIKIVQFLLKNNVDINGGEYTALSRAATEGHTKIVKLLINNGADVNAKDPWRYTIIGNVLSDDYLLNSKEKKNSRDIIKILLENDADFNLNTHNYTVLMWASLWGYTDIVKLLLNAQADINAIDANNKTALIYATDNGHTDIVQLLKAASATK